LAKLSLVTAALSEVRGRLIYPSCWNHIIIITIIIIIFII